MLPILTELRHALDMQVALENHVEEGNFCKILREYMDLLLGTVLMIAYFNAPDGDEPLALDMGSMGKGQVWINGQSIGRYWTAFATGNCNGYGEYGTRFLCLIKHKADAW
ncbi:hypothetical protein HYC85_026302 [Camellia sinensis]|uniref:Beta-galactosidase galactose-binding domain-containing protein n=1 Tax=Camellia sinensis TaxID=4442 RepID=A0A7J7G365_CAMSI|nr:hypothetical protein HYC85_026302 [Camellia sinensis]